MFSRAVRHGHNGEDRVEPAVGDQYAPISDIEVIQVVYPAKPVDDGGGGVVPHATGARLVLSSCYSSTATMCPCLSGSCSLYNLQCFSREKCTMFFVHRVA